MLIGLTGHKQVGKDTCAAYLEERYGFEVDAFAAPLKEACRAIFGLTHGQLYGELKEVVDPFWQKTPRQIMQTVGTEVGRQIDPEVWVKAFCRRYERSQPHRLVVTDVRFPNEAVAIRQLGGRIIRITRPGHAGDNHASETAQADITPDGTLHNGGSIPDLHKNLVSLMYTVLR